MSSKAHVIHSYFKKNAGRFFENKAGNVVLFFKGNLYAVGDSEFNKLVTGLNLS